MNEERLENDSDHSLRLGLGCWPLGGDQWGVQDEQESIAVIRRALELGITHFDTAYSYGKGNGERILGEALGSDRYNVKIATKIMPSPREKIEGHLTASLRRLGADAIDLLYIHWPRRAADLAGMMEALEKCRVKGLIRKIGVSNFSVAAMEEVMSAGRIDAHQLGWNLLWRVGEHEIIPFCRKHGIDIVSYSSLAEGILTGKFGSRLDFPKGDHRRHTLLFGELVWQSVWDAVEEMKKVAQEFNRPLGHCAIRWLLARGEASTVLVGARHVCQVEDNRAALEGAIDKECLWRLTAISDRLQGMLPVAPNIFNWSP